MARYILLIGMLHSSGGEPVVIAGPSYDVEAMKSKYKSEFAPERVHPKFERVEYVDSVVGVRKHKNFITPAESKRREKELKRQVAAVGTESPPETQPETQPETSPETQPETQPETSPETPPEE